MMGAPACASQARLAKMQADTFFGKYNTSSKAHAEEPNLVGPRLSKPKAADAPLVNTAEHGTDARQQAESDTLAISKSNRVFGFSDALLLDKLENGTCKSSVSACDVQASRSPTNHVRNASTGAVFCTLHGSVFQISGDAALD